MLEVTSDLVLDESEIEETFVRAAGPGGQNVNKVSTSVQLRFDALHSPSLPEEVRARLLHLAGNRLTGEGVIVIQSREYRSQERNRQEARRRLVELVRRATEKPKKRHKTRPTQASRERRLEAKRRQSEVKRQRSRWRGEE